VAEEPRQKRLAGAVGADDSGVLAGADRQGQAVEDAAVVANDRGVCELEDRGTLYQVEKLKSGRSGRSGRSGKVSVK
jgi:hypothetical protein